MAAALIGDLFTGLLGALVQGEIASEDDTIAAVERWARKRRDAQAAGEAALRERDAAADAAAARLPEGPPAPAAAPDPAMSPKRQLCYRYLALPYLAQIQLAQALDLLRNEDRGIDDAALFGRIYDRATERGMLAELTAAVEAAHAPEGAGG